MKQELAEIARKKREGIIKEFYETHKGSFKASAEKGYSGLSVDWDALDDQQKLALRAEEGRLSEIITEVDISIKTKESPISKTEYYDRVAFRWD